MSNHQSAVRRRAGVSGILVFLVMVTALGLVFTGGLNERDVEEGAVDPVLSNMADNPTIIVLAMWGFLIMNILMVFFSIELYRVLDNKPSELIFAPVSLIGGSALFIIETLMTIGITQGLASAYTDATGAEQKMIGDTALTLLQFRNHTALLAGVLIAVSAVLFGRGMMRSTEFPRWMGYWGFIIGVFGVIGAFYPLLDPLSFVRLLDQLLFGLWVLVSGIILLRG